MRTAVMAGNSSFGGTRTAWLNAALLVWCGFWAMTVGAQPRVALVFGDHMVLQADMPVPVWGVAKAGEHVTVSFAGSSETVEAGGDGRWMVRLPPMQASRESRSLRVEGTSGERVFNDVVVGEVWLCGGQSNMQVPLAKAGYRGAELKPEPSEWIRFNLRGGEWQVGSEETLSTCSAVAYYFALDVLKEAKRPVGLILRAHPGTALELWADADTLRELPYVREMEEKCAHGDLPALREAYQQAVLNHRKEVQAWRSATPDERKGKNPPEPPHDVLLDDVTRADYDWYRPGRIGGGFRTNILPVAPYALRGAIWYQGETNAEISGGPLAYRDLLPALIRSWRTTWGQGDFPFFYVQLPNYKDAGWPLLREGMREALSVPNTGMAITIDIGDARDIHPPNKPEVGRRLGLLARHRVYGAELVDSGPLPIGIRAIEAEIEVDFAHAEDGLVAKDGQLDGFEIAGDDGEFIPAQARIEGSQLRVWSQDVSRPKSVRYAWAANPSVSLFNNAGLPASPFRKDL